MSRIEFIEEWICGSLFDSVPMAIAVIGEDYEILKANKKFEEMFGPWRGRKCYQVYKKRDKICGVCMGREAMRDGKARIHEEEGLDRSNRKIKYIQHAIPIRTGAGANAFLVEITTDITELEQVRREYRLLFDQVPCYVLLIDKNFKIVRINNRLKELFGDIEGSNCFRALKGREQKCDGCTAGLTFHDEKIHSGRHIWRLEEGREADLMVQTVPLRESDGTFRYVMEMAVDITETLRLESELKKANVLMSTMIEHATDGIIVQDTSGSRLIVNPAARRILGVPDGAPCDAGILDKIMPREFLSVLDNKGGRFTIQETEVRRLSGEHVPVRLSGITLKHETGVVGKAFFIQDIGPIKRLEAEKLEVERLAAVGQTVAGLAHGIKNLVNALEGGLYLLKSGLEQKRTDRLATGLDMLSRNISRISMFVKEFLAFARGREARVCMVDPGALAKEVVGLFAPRAASEGISIEAEVQEGIEPAPMDPDGIHEALTNLVGNAIDACQMSEDGTGNSVLIRVYEKEGVIVFEVSDNGCGMDYDIKQKVFTSFFTTKGLGGTGLGLLTTKKIVQEHGGTIDFATESGKGSTFYIRLPRKRLPRPRNKKDS